MHQDYADIVAALGPDNQAFAGKIVLLTGSQGFLGRLYQRYFEYLNGHVLRERVKVICMDSAPRDSREHRPLHFHHLTRDIASPHGFDLTAGGETDYIINAAGLASPQAYASRPFDTINVSVQGTDNILKLAKTLKCSVQELFS